MKHLLSIADLSRDEIVGLMDEADRFREALLAGTAVCGAVCWGLLVLVARRRGGAL